MNTATAATQAAIVRSKALAAKLLFLTTGGSVKRFHTMDTIKENTDAHHSWGLAMLAYYLTSGNPSVNLLMACLVHDLAEQEVGDVPSPTKRHMANAVGRVLHDVESKVLADKGLTFTLSVDEQAVLNLADCMDGMLFCITERRMGNKNVDVAFWRYYKYCAQEKLDWPIKVEILSALLDMWEEAAK